MPIIAKEGGGTYVQPPAGTFAAVCVDVADLGILEVTFGGETKKQHKIKLVWQLSEIKPDGKPYVISKRYTLSLHEKSSLRKDLQAWRGRPFTPAELGGFDLEALISVPALLNVIEETRAGKTFSNVASIMRIPKGMECPVPRDYVRVCDRTTESVAVAPPPHESDSYEITDDDVPF